MIFSNRTFVGAGIIALVAAGVVLLDGLPEQPAMHEYIGDTIVFLDDTLVVVRYDEYGRFYELSNGSQVHPVIVETHLIAGDDER